MKIAILYSGNLRTYEYCVNNHAEVIGNADVYISTWNTINRIDNINDPWHSKLDIDLPSLVTEEYIINKTPSNFNIRKIKINSYSDINIINLKKYSSLNYQYFSILDSFNLLNDVKDEYDYIIRLRPDITITNIKLDKEYLIFNENIWFDYKFNNISINEMIWISPNIEYMRKTCNIFNNLITINEQLDYDDFYGEKICLENLKLEEILDNVRLNNFEY